MLWKLADNVKYEDDCEVSVGKARTEKEVCRLIKDGAKVGTFGNFQVEFLLQINESLERKKGIKRFSGQKILRNTIKNNL